jgi:hypothetical protein
MHVEMGVHEVDAAVLGGRNRIDHMPVLREAPISLRKR